MIRLKSIDAKRFLGIEGASYEFHRPVTVFQGGNGAGKSSTLDAIAALLTGTAREVKKKDLLLLSHHSSGFVVNGVASIGDGPIDLRTTTSGETPSRTAKAAQFGDAAILTPCLDWKAWRGMSKTQRERIIQMLGAETEWPAGLPKLPKEVAEALESKGLHAAKNKAAEQRRACQRFVKEAGDAAAPTSEQFYEAMGEKHDLAKVDTVQLAERAQKGRKMASELEAEIAQLGAMDEDERRRRIDELRQAKARFEEAGENLETVEAELEATRGKEREAQQRVIRLNADVLAREKALAGFEEGVAQCHACGKPYTKEELDKARDEALNASNALATAREAYDTAEDSLAPLADQRRELEDRQASLRQARRLYDPNQDGPRLKQLEAMGQRNLDQDLNGLERKLNRCRDRLSELADLRSRAMAFQETAAGLASLREKVERNKKHAEAYEKVEAAIQGQIDAGGSDLAGIINMRLEEFGRHIEDWKTIEFDADACEPRINGMPLTLRCRSDQYLALVAMQYVIAAMSGIRFLVVDDLDTVTPARRKQVQAWMSAVAGVDGFQIIAAVAKDGGKEAETGKFQVINIQ